MELNRKDASNFIVTLWKEEGKCKTNHRYELVTGIGENLMSLYRPIKELRVFVVKT
jgi:hypothetical protein